MSSTRVKKGEAAVFTAPTPILRSAPSSILHKMFIFLKNSKVGGCRNEPLKMLQQARESTEG